MRQYQTQPLKNSSVLSLVIVIVLFSLVVDDQPIASAKSSGIWYRVRKGDTVWDIARNEVCSGVLGFGEFRLDDG